MISLRKAFIELQVSVSLAGLTGVIGRLINMHQLPMVWYRVFLAAIIISVVMAARKRLHHIDPYVSELNLRQFTNKIFNKV